MDIGFRINPSPTPADASLLAVLRLVATSHLSDNMHRGVGIGGLRRYTRAGKLVGTAFTVRTRPGDNLMVHKALMLIRPGDVLVVDGGGETANALVGELMKLEAERRGCAGFVIDGAIRDVAAFERSEFPCYARGHVHKGPYKDGPGEINGLVCIAGQVIAPGDIVVGDEDGLVAFAPEHAARLVRLANEQAAREERVKQDIAAGCWDRSWVDRALGARGVIRQMRSEAASTEQER